MTRLAGGQQKPPADGQICSLFGVDIVGFTRPDRDDDIRRHLHTSLFENLKTAFDQSGIPWEECWHEDRGDGALVVIPPHLTAKNIIHRLIERLRTLVRLQNHVSREAAKVQLRLAVHIGPVDHDGEGFIGTDINDLFRLLDARPFKRALANSTAELALIVSDYVYRTVVCRYPSMVSPEAFHPVRFQVKYTRAKAWIYLPGLPTLATPACGTTRKPTRVRRAGRSAPRGSRPSPATYGIGSTRSLSARLPGKSR
ncbi:MAG: hypothetical protein ABSF03_22925 [Streptosporangiaceae bacterium]